MLMSTPGHCAVASMSLDVCPTCAYRCSRVAANYPDVMMGAFNQTKVAPLFFTLYLMLTLYFVMNIFLAMVYGFYQERELIKAKAIFMHRRKYDPPLVGVPSSAAESLGLTHWRWRWSDIVVFLALVASQSGAAGV